MNDTDQAETALELVVKADYIKPKLEVLETFSNCIGVTISIGP
jgi:hypothetical protein